MIVKFIVPLMHDPNKYLRLGDNIAHMINSKYSEHDVTARNVRVLSDKADYLYKIYVETSNQSAQFIADLGYEVSMITDDALHYINNSYSPRYHQLI